MSIAKKVVDLFPSSQEETPESTEEPDDPSSTELFECEPCGTTFISSSMDECPNCEGEVRSIRSEKDLGML